MADGDKSYGGGEGNSECAVMVVKEKLQKKVTRHLGKDMERERSHQTPRGTVFR
jgi:hypothetical protein